MGCEIFQQYANIRVFPMLCRNGKASTLFVHDKIKICYPNLVGNFIINFTQSYGFARKIRRSNAIAIKLNGTTLLQQKRPYFSIQIVGEFITILKIPIGQSVKDNSSKLCTVNLAMKQNILCNTKPLFDYYFQCTVLEVIIGFAYTCRQVPAQRQIIYRNFNSQRPR